MNAQLFTGFSFNRYFGAGTLLSHMTVRFNFSDDQRGKELALEIAEDLKTNASIVAYSDWQPFGVSDDVKKGCEIASTIALEFRDWMNTHQEVFQYFWQNKIRFMSRFLLALLGELGFKASNYESYPISNIIERIEELAQSCANSCRSEMPQSPNIDFMERFIHHFMNCILIDIGREEPAIYGTIQHFSWLDSLIQDEEN